MLGAHELTEFIQRLQLLVVIAFVEFSHHPEQVDIFRQTRANGAVFGTPTVRANQGFSYPLKKFTDRQGLDMCLVWILRILLCVETSSEIRFATDFVIDSTFE